MALKLALDLDGVLGDTRRLWNDWLADAARRYRVIAKLDVESVPSDRAEAARVLDQWSAQGVGDWRAALERFAEDRAPVYLRPDAEIGIRLRELQSTGASIGVFTDAPEPLARIALSQLGASRRIDAVETGAGALERLLAQLGPGTVVVRSRSDFSRIDG
jgi:phosphoglycolate phosphatase-like HAD superfamily hydrolase